MAILFPVKSEMAILFFVKRDPGPPFTTLYVQHNKQHHKKVLLSSFHLIGHTLGIHPQTQKLEPPCTA